MVQTVMTDEMKTNFNTNFHQAALTESSILTAIPWAAGQETYLLEYYYAADLPRAATGMKYAHEDATEVHHVKLTNPPCAIWKDFRINDVDLQILARTQGMGAGNTWARKAARLFTQEIAYAMYQGNTGTGMAGLLSKAGNSDATASAINTAPNFLTLAANMKDDMTADGFWPPYVFIQSTGMQVGWDKPINAAPVSKWTQGDSIMGIFSTMNDGNAGGTAKILWELNGTSSGNTIKPLPAADNDDGVALLLKPVQNGEVYLRGIWCQPITSTEWDFDNTTNMWHTRIKCKVGLEVYDVNSICKHTDIDYE